MDKINLTFGNHLNLLLVFIFCLIFLLFVSCGYSPQNESFSTNPIIKDTKPKSKDFETELVVKKFMNYISDNKLEEANSLIKTSRMIPETKKTVQETPMDFNWARVFKDRDLSLNRIISNYTFDNGAKVKALLTYNKDPRINLEALFYIQNVNNQWSIYDIKFITNIDK